MKALVRWMPPGLCVVLGFFPVCFILGAAIGIGFYPGVIAIAALFAVAAIVSQPRLAVWITIVGALVVAGMVELYLPRYQVIRWAFALLGMAIGSVVVVRAVWEGRAQVSADSRRVLQWGFLFFICSFLASLLDSGSLLTATIGLKGYFQMWGLMLAIAFLGYKPQEANRIMGFFACLALIQLPIALQQFLVLVPLRTNDLDAAHAVVAIDIVSGSFGGALHGGGRSIDSAVLACIGIAIALALWRTGRIGAWRALSATAVMLSPMLLNEAKFVLIALPFALFVVYREKVLKNPLQFIGGAMVTAAILSMMLIGYSLLPGARSQKRVTFDKYAAEMIRSNFGEEGYGRSYLNRTTVYRHWFNENVMEGRIANVLLGYGVGATNERSALSGDESLAAKHYATYNIGLTSISGLLWEVGVLGLLTVAGLFLSLYRLASRLAAAHRNSPHWPFLVSAQAAVPVLALTLPVANYFMFDLGFQAMFVTLAGYLLCMSNALQGDRRAES